MNVDAWKSEKCVCGGGSIGGGTIQDNGQREVPPRRNKIMLGWGGGGVREYTISASSAQASKIPVSMTSLTIGNTPSSSRMFYVFKGQSHLKNM